MAAEKIMATRAEIEAALRAPNSAPEKPVQLSMNDVHFFARAAAKVRGFPIAALDDIAFRIVWLEQRGLPGLTYFAAELMDNDHMPLIDRAKFSYEPTLTLLCPIFSGSLIKENFDELVSGDENEIRVMRGPSHAFLILSKLAQYADERDIPIVVSWTTSDCSVVAARTIIYNHQIIQQGSMQDIVDADGVGVSRFSGSLPEVFKGGDEEHAHISPVTMLKLISYCARDKKTPMQKQQSDIEKTITHDARLDDLFSRLTTREVALITGAADEGEGTELVTRTGSSNDQFWSHLSAIGWLSERAPLAAGLKTFVLTDLGRDAIPVMLKALYRAAA